MNSTFKTRVFNMYPDKTCTICQDTRCEITQYNFVLTESCCHLFHIECLSGWYNSEFYKNKFGCILYCPNCNALQPKDSYLDQHKLDNMLIAFHSSSTSSIFYYDTRREIVNFVHELCNIPVPVPVPVDAVSDAITREQHEIFNDYMEAREYRTRNT